MAELSPEEQALAYAGRLADCALSLVGGEGLNGRIQPTSLDNFSERALCLRRAAEQYNQHILTMSRHA
jgi:hypothetical protein